MGTKLQQEVRKVLQILEALGKPMKESAKFREISGSMFVWNDHSSALKPSLLQSHHVLGDVLLFDPYRVLRTKLKKSLGTWQPGIRREVCLQRKEHRLQSRQVMHSHSTYLTYSAPMDMSAFSSMYLSFSSMNWRMVVQMGDNVRILSVAVGMRYQLGVTVFPTH